MARRLISALWTAVLISTGQTAAAADEVKSYTHSYFLYSVDYPESWRVKELSKTSIFLSPLDSKEDRFAENVTVVAEDMSLLPGVTLMDYHRKSSGEAPRRLSGFRTVDESETVWLGRPAILEIYTMQDRGQSFKCKAVKFMEGKTAYVLTYNAVESDFDRFLPEAEKLMRSIRVSP